MFSAFHLKRHDQVLSGPVEVHRHHHFVGFDHLRCYLLPTHHHGRQALADFLLLADGDDFVGCGPVASLNAHVGHHEGFLVYWLVTVSLGG